MSVLPLYIEPLLYVASFIKISSTFVFGSYFLANFMHQSFVPWALQGSGIAGIHTFIIHPILLSNQSAPVAPGDFKIKSHIRTAARHTSLLTK